MYSHPEINYKPQHPMLQSYTQPQQGYTIEEEGVFDSIKAGLSAASDTLKKGAKAVMEAGANMAGVSTAPKAKMTKKNGTDWLMYYMNARKIMNKEVPQADEYRLEQENKKLYAKLKKQTDGVISYDDARKLAGVK